jgi:hypothetical protein
VNLSFYDSELPTPGPSPVAASPCKTATSLDDVISARVLTVLERRIAECSGLLAARSPIFLRLYAPSFSATLTGDAYRGYDQACNTSASLNPRMRPDAASRPAGAAARLFTTP